MYSRSIDGLGEAWYESLLQTGNVLYQKYQDIKNLQAVKKKAEIQATQLRQLQEMQQQIQAARAIEPPPKPQIFGMDTSTALAVGAIGIISLMFLRKR